MTGDLPAPDLTRAEMALWLAGYWIGCDRGWEDGYREAYERADRELVAALAGMLGGDPDVIDYREGVRRHLRVVGWRAARAAADRGELAA